MTIVGVTDPKGDRIEEQGERSFADRALFLTLGSIEGKQDLILDRLNKQDRDREKLQEHVTEIDNRVGKIESRMTYIAGGLAFVGSAFVFFRERITAFFGGL